MLFLLNRHIVEIDAPERHLDRFWRRLGCGDPACISPEQAVKFAVMVVNDHILDGFEPGEDTLGDLAALIITKTGANAALFDGTKSARLNILPEEALLNLQSVLARGRDKELEDCWAQVA